MPNKGVHNTVTHRFLICLATIAVVIWPTLVLATTPDGAKKFIEGLSKQALQALQSEGDLGAKEQKVQVLLSETFDLQLIGRYVMGPAWKKATLEQQVQYQALFRQFVLQTYSRRLGGYSGQTFLIVGAKPIGKKDVLVSTKIARPSGPPVLAGWRVRQKAGSHRILDVMVSGVSMVVTQRSEFRAVVRRQGINGLIETLRAQVSKFSVTGS